MSDAGTHAMPAFDLETQDIRSGCFLIEASAGTGKTFNIQHLYLRLLLERPELRLRQILVVTFTEAATAELRERIRNNLVRAHAYAAARLIVDGVDFRRLTSDAVVEHAAACGADATLLRLLLRATAGDEARLRDAAQRLRLAVLSFDEASIFTIHGFCSRVLNDNAFETRALFDTELTADETRLLRQAVEDFWRRSFYGQSPTWAAAALAGGFGCADMVRFAGRLCNRPDAVPMPATVSPREMDVDACLADLQACCTPEALAAAARGGRRIGTAAAALARALEPPVNASDVFAVLPNLLGRKSVCKQEKLHEALAALAEAQRYFIMSLKLQLRAHLLEADVFRDHKRRQGVLSFQDLLLDVREALRDADGGLDGEGALARQLREQYRAVLIDEFQDTDPVQFDIFTTCFHHPGSLLFMIGDPKQSIYAFRGADIFSYLSAAAAPDVGRRTLTANFRSTPRLLAALDGLFDTPNPFVYPQIGYRPAAAGRPAGERLVVRGETDDAPCRFWWLPGRDGQAWVRAEAETRILHAVAGRIAGMLQAGLEGKASIESTAASGARRPLSAPDVAVLVSTNKQAAAMQAQLLERGVPSVIQSSGNIFLSAEAQDMYRILGALCEPARRSALSTALSTAFIGLDAEQLCCCQEGEGEAQLVDDCWREIFAAYHRQWQRQGFVQMFTRFLQPERPAPAHPAAALSRAHPALRKDVVGNLLELPNGERRLTNVRHLVELIHAAAVQQRLTPPGVVVWLGRQIAAADSDSREEHELRLERDAAAVTILTVHKSKGLQYPVVFCPFLWSRGFRRPPKTPGSQLPVSSECLCHETTAAGTRAVLDLGSADIPRRRHAKRVEELAESLRLLYVAVTRAQLRCYIVWGEIQKTDNTPLMYLRRRLEADGVDGFVQRPAASFTAADLGIAVGDGTSARPGSCDVNVWEAAADIVLEPVPAADGRYAPPAAAADLRAAPWPAGRTVPADWGVMSYSELARHASHDRQARADDDGRDQQAADVRLPFADFPRGGIAGNCVHEVFECLDYTRVSGASREAWASPPDVAPLLTRILSKYGFLPARRSAAAAVAAAAPEPRRAQLCDMVHRVLNTPLQPVAGEAFQLNTPGIRRVTELDFFFHVATAIDCGRWNAFLQAHSVHWRGDSDTIRRGIETLTTACGKAPGARHGFMHGQIDLVFVHGGRYYLLDWKTAWLGERCEDYAPDKLAVHMVESAYLLQYCIYTVALHRHLRQRLGEAYAYGDHVGGGFYLYVRGMAGDDSGNGVFYDRIDDDAIDELDAIFGGGTAGVTGG